MHTQTIEKWSHSHVFLGASHRRNERRAWIVVGITAAMMVIEIVAGSVFGSMALLADGFHMATHAGALTLAALAYLFARRHAENPRFSFGTGKLGELAGFASAVILGVIALFIAGESLGRLAAPVPIGFESAMGVAVVGLLVNLACAWLLGADHDHGHAHGHGHGHGHAHDHDHGGEHHHGHPHHHHSHDDHNLRGAYLHVLTDALTSVLAIAALGAGWALGWIWLDPMMGIVGAAVIAHWSWGLMKGAGAVLLDAVPDESMNSEIRDLLEVGGDRIADLHLWRVGPGHVAAIVSLVSDRPQPPAHYKARLSGLAALSHVTVEVNACPHRAAA